MLRDLSSYARIHLTIVEFWSKMKMKKIIKSSSLVAFAFLLVLSLAISGCSSKSKGAKDGDGKLSEEDLAAQREGRFGGGNIPRAEGEGPFHDVHFDFDSSSINADAQRDIEFNSDVLKQNNKLKIVLEGHCDERGTAEYNMALGSKRAQAVRQVLVSLGVASSSLETISYGEEVPLDPGHDESAWSANRRVHFSGY